MKLNKLILATYFITALAATALPSESFEEWPVGGMTHQKISAGTWSAAPNNASILKGHAHKGNSALRILGGNNHQVEFEPSKVIDKPSRLVFWAERWTRKDPFSFTVETQAKGSKEWKNIYNGSKIIKIGGYHTQVDVLVPADTAKLRFTCTSAEGGGILIDDISVTPVKPMQVGTVTSEQPVIPSLIKKKINPVIALKVNTSGHLDPLSLTAVKLNLRGTIDVNDVKSLQLIQWNGKGQPGEGTPFGKPVSAPANVDESIILNGDTKLVNGENTLWVCVELLDSASLDHKVDAEILEITIKDKKLTPEITAPEGSQRIGYAVRQHGDDGSKAFRIPGLATTNKGTLIGVYDVRYRTGGDLPGDIDVGMSRSTDGGQTWEKMKVIMDMGNDPKWKYDGIGDPAVLVDSTTERIWVGATWSHGNRSWRGSGQGITPEETGQVMLAYSDDDGLTWSKPINITEQVKPRKDWHFVLHGPGAGITMKDGTLVFAAQYQDESKHPDGRKKAYPWSTIFYSKDQGKTWHTGTGIKGNTTEAQVVELADGSLMLNCRDNRGGSRTIGITKDLGKTWTMHPTDRKALQEPVCMASLLRLETKKHGNLLFFSNPNTKRGRKNMTIKVSQDEGMTWPEQRHHLYDTRYCSGYSCLTPVGKDHVGVYYEGPHEIYYLRFKIADLLKEN